jgi:WD40 repeat protein
MSKPVKIAALMIITALLISSISSLAYPQTGEPILTIETGIHSSMIRDMVVDAGNRILVTGSNDKTVRIWDLSTGKLLKILRPPIGQGAEGIVHAVAISPDGNTIACGGNSRNADKSYNIFFFDRESGRLIKRVSGLPTAVLSLRFSKDGHRLAAGLWGLSSKHPWTRF